CIIKGVAQDTNTARISVLNVKNIPGVAYKVFQSLAEDNIDVDMIVQSVQTSNDNMTDIVFTINSADLNDARKSLGKLKRDGLIPEVVYDDDTAKISVVGAGMLGTPGVAARMFGALGSVGINILIVSTSEISVSCLIKREDVDKAVQAIHREFFGKSETNG
ncbi:MAG: ACT domain-containing protein, partial [Dialister sp.]|nr:ACT domain-containing protein [Dialister sp.]